MIHLKHFVMFGIKMANFGVVIAREAECLVFTFDLTYTGIWPQLKDFKSSLDVTDRELSNATSRVSLRPLNLEKAGAINDAP